MASTSDGKHLTENHRRLQIALQGATQITARQYRSLVNLDNIDATFPRYYAVMDQLAEQGGKRSARLAAEYLGHYIEAETDGSAQWEVQPYLFNRRNFIAETYSAGNYYTKRLIGQGVDPQQAWEKAATLVEARLGQHVLAGGRSTISTMDFRYHGQSGRWRRVTDGNPCAFCAMLAGRGPVYKSGEDFRTHGHCGCTLELVVGQWEPTRQEALWRASYLSAAREAQDEHGTRWARTAAGEGNILARMRRNSPELFHDGVFAKASRDRSQAWEAAARPAMKRGRQDRSAPNLSNNWLSRGFVADLPSWFSRDAQPEVTQEFIDKTAFGAVHESNARRIVGGHLERRTPRGKRYNTEVPSNWSRSDVEGALRQILKAPHWAGMSTAGTRYLRRDFDGVVWEARYVVRVSGESVLTNFHPIGGGGTIVVTREKRSELPRPKNWLTSVKYYK